MSLLNSFLLGADPEFVIVNDGHLQQYQSSPDPYVPWGLDHSGWVIEPHPKPEMSVRQLVDNLKVSMNDFATVAPEGKWRAGAYLRAPERTITLGGHVHVDQPHPTGAQVTSFDLFTSHLEALDVLPSAECASRRGAGLHYGAFGDVRNEHGHYEYRTFPSWLFSQRVTKLALLGTKLIAVEPGSVEEIMGAAKTASLTKLKKFYERFKGRDDDVDWVLASGMLDRGLKVDPDKDLRDVWKVKPQKEDPHWKRAQRQAVNPPTPTRLVNPCAVVGELIVYVSSWDHLPSAAHTRAIQARLEDSILPQVYSGTTFRGETAVGEFRFFVVGRAGQRTFSPTACRTLHFATSNGVEHVAEVLASQANSGVASVRDRLARLYEARVPHDRLRISEEGLAYIIRE